MRAMTGERAGSGFIFRSAEGCLLGPGECATLALQLYSGRHYVGIVMPLHLSIGYVMQDLIGLRCTSCVVLGNEPSYGRMVGNRAADGELQVAFMCEHCGYVTKYRESRVKEILQNQLDRLAVRWDAATD